MDEELHKRAIKKFTRRKVMVKFVNEIWGIDLIEMPKDINEYNENKFIFCVIDCFSRFVYCVAMKNKKAETTIEALKLVVKKAKAIPKKIWADEGVEFLNKEYV
jgi:transposase InsO family protein